MRRGAGYRRPELGELLAKHLKKATGIGRKTPLFGQPAQQLGLAIGTWGIESVGHMITRNFPALTARVVRGLPA